MSRKQFDFALAGLLGCALVLASCLPVNGPIRQPSSNPDSSNPFAITTSGSGSSGPSDPACQHYTAGDPFFGYCNTCVRAVLDLYCSGSATSSGCSTSIQTSFNSRVNQCISNTLNFGFPCAVTCQSGFVLTPSCSCSPSSSGGGSSGSNTPPNSNGGTTNSGAPTSTARLVGIPGAASSTQACEFDMELTLAVSNRSLTSPSQNTYTLDTNSVSEGSNSSHLTSVSPLQYFFDPVSNTHAFSGIAVRIGSLSSTGPLSLDWVSLLSGTLGVSDTVGSADPTSLADARWNASMGHLVSVGTATGTGASRPRLFVADTGNNRIRMIDFGADRVSRVAFNPSSVARTKLVNPYGIAAVKDATLADIEELHVAQWGFGGSSPPPAGAAATSSLLSLCNSNASLSRPGFCSTDVNGCLEKEVTTTVVPRNGTVSQSADADCPATLSDQEAGAGVFNHSYKVTLHQTSTPGGIDHFKASDPNNDRIYYTLPYSRVLKVISASNRHKRSDTGTWAAGQTSIQYGTRPLWLINNTPVTVFGKEACGTSNAFWRDTLPGNLFKETLYFVVGATSNAVSLSRTPDGPAITLTSLTVSNTSGFGANSCAGTLSDGQITLAQWTDSSAGLSPPPGFTTPVDVKLDAASGRAYVIDSGTGILWWLSINTTTAEPGTVWTQINTPPTSTTSSLPPDSVVPSGSTIPFRFVNPLALTVIPNQSGTANVLVVEGANPNPGVTPGGRTVRVYCSRNDSSGTTAGIADLCRGRAIGIYRVAGFPEGDPRAASFTNASVFSGNSLFRFPVGVAAFSTPGSRSSVFVTSGGADRAIFGLYPEDRSPLLGIRYTISDVYGQTAHQCLRFHAVRACNGSGCSCKAVAPRDTSGTTLTAIPSLWEEVSPNQSCLPLPPP